MSEEQSKTSRVALIGAGPGDPDLLTLKALRYMRSADVVLCDRLVSQQIQDLIPAGISKIMVGKSPGNHCIPQDEINQLMLKLATKGRFIVRLKGGDPYCFGRGGEEAEFLHQNKVQFEVVPGITSALGCSAYTGIPLTHRGISRSVRFVTGHVSNDEPLNLNWSKLADAECTLVVYMGLASLEEICGQLIRHGLDESTPSAAIQDATIKQQQSVLSTLSSLPDEVKKANFQSPVIVIIGEVVTLSEKLNWFEERNPLTHDSQDVLEELKIATAIA